MKLELDNIRKQGYEAHSKGRDLKDNPNQSHNRREAWKEGWLEAKAEYLCLLGGSNEVRRVKFVWIVTEYRPYSPHVDRPGGEHIPVFVCSSQEQAGEYVDCLSSEIDWSVSRHEVHVGTRKTQMKQEIDQNVQGWMERIVERYRHQCGSYIDILQVAAEMLMECDERWAQACANTMDEYERGRDAAIKHITNLLSKDKRLVLHAMDNDLVWTILPEEPHTYLAHPKEHPP